MTKQGGEINAMSPIPSQPYAATPKIGGIARDVSAGLVSAAVTVTYGLSFAALLFMGPLEPLLPYGLSVALISASLGAIIVCLTSSLPQAVGGPDTSITMIMSSLLISLHGELTALGAGGLVLPHVMLVLFLVTLATAASLWLLGWFQLGHLIRYVPYPVIGGFLAATGWLMATGALGIATGTPVTMVWLTRLMVEGPDGPTIAALGLALMFLIVLRRWNRPAALPILLSGTIFTVHAGLALAGIGLAEARHEGWVFRELNEPAYFAVLTLFDSHQWKPGAVEWRLLAGHAGDLIAILIIAAITVPLGAAGLEVTSKRDFDLDRELRGHGLANAVIALAGGYVALLSIGRTLVILKSGGTSRWAGLVAGSASAAVILIGPILVGLLPKVVLAGFLLYLGLILLEEWLVLTVVRKRLSKLDYLMVLLVLAITVQFGFGIGMLVGGIAASLCFVATYSRIPVIPVETDGTARRSGRARTDADLRVLETRGAAIRVMELQGFLFFGVTRTLLDRVRDRLTAPPQPQVLILDLGGVDGVDASAENALVKAYDQAERAGVTMILSAVPLALRHILAGRTNTGLAMRCRMASDLPEALEWAEDAVLAAHRLSTPESGTSPPPAWFWLADDLGVDILGRLTPYLEWLDLPRGACLFRAGEAADSLYLLAAGRIGLIAFGRDGHPERLSSLTAGAVFGSEAFDTAGVHPATALAVVPCVVFRVSRDALQHLEIADPALSATFHRVLFRRLARQLELGRAGVPLRSTTRPALPRSATLRSPSVA